MELAGESAWIFDSKNPGQHPWHRQMRIPPIMRELGIHWARLQYILFRREGDLTLYFKRSLNVAFVQGYLRAKRRTQIPTARRLRSVRADG